ncbi:MAG: hypothetical protein R3C56_30250 [Pirellulaceae bacterium]
MVASKAGILTSVQQTVGIGAEFRNQRRSRQMWSTGAEGIAGSGKSVATGAMPGCGAGVDRGECRIALAPACEGSSVSKLLEVIAAERSLDSRFVRHQLAADL